jgi:uncharacterized lipoprotein YmbA
VKTLSRFVFPVAVILLGGCSGSPSIHYYTLSAEASPDSSLTGKQEPFIAVGPVTLPDVVDRPQLVLRTTRNSVTLIEEHQWAEPLTSEIPRVIADNLARLLGTRQIFVYPQSAGDRAEYRVLMDVQQFESALDDRVSIDALWIVRHSGEGAAFSKTGRSNVEEPTGSTGYEALAAAHSRALARISREIAEAIRSTNGAR